MNVLQETLQKIGPLDETVMRTVEKKLTSFLPNAHAFGYLKEILINYAGITRQATPDIPKKCTIVACGDHGVAEMKISAYPVETTVQMTKNYLISKGAVANALSNFSGARMIVVDMGIAAPVDEIPGLIDRKIAYGTNNCAKGPAMTRAEALRAIETGIEIASEYAAKGYRCFLPGEMGIANTTSSAAIVATLCGLTPEQATGRGTNISDERLQVKINVVRQALAVNRPDAKDGVDILAKVGGFELGCITGLILGAAANHSFVVLDGFNTGAAALIACRIAPLAKHYLMGSHLAAEPAHQKTLEMLGIRPYMDMRFRLGEATGSSIAVNLLDAMIRAYQALQAKADCAFAIKKAPECSGDIAMENVNKCISNIRPLDNASMEKCQFHIDNLTKPIHSLGVLEQLAVKIAGITSRVKPNQLQKSILEFTATPTSSPASIALIQAFAAHANAALAITGLPNSACASRTDVLSAMEIGMRGAAEEIERGKTILGLRVSSDETKDAAASILAAYAKDANTEPLEALQRANRAELASLTGAILSAANRRAVIVLDDFTTQIAALLAIKLAPEVRSYCVCPEASPLVEHGALKELLNLPSHLNLQFTIGEGSLSALGMKLIDASLHMLNDMKTFEEAAVAVANDGPGAARQKA